MIKISSRRDFSFLERSHFKVDWGGWGEEDHREKNSIYFPFQN